MNYKTRYWDYNLELENNDKKVVMFTVNYDSGYNYNISSSYRLEHNKDNSTSSNYNINLNYYKLIYNLFEYKSNLGFDYEDNFKVSLSQTIEYSIKRNHVLSVNLNLSRRLESDTELNKNLVLSYKYDF
jgi:hypothetical protein